MSKVSEGRSVSPVAVAVCAWLVPGGGYFVLGDRKRGLTVGISIIILFLLGVLIGGIRIMDPPGWGLHGYMTQIVERRTTVGRSLYQTPIHIDPVNQAEEDDPGQEGDRPVGPALLNDFTSELGDKPWFVGQILCGPLTLAGSAISVHEARQGVTLSHARSWEIGALYTAVAGMLNLLVIIDSTFRSTQPQTFIAAAVPVVADANSPASPTKGRRP